MMSSGVRGGFSRSVSAKATKTLNASEAETDFHLRGRGIHLSLSMVSRQLKGIMTRQKGDVCRCFLPKHL